MTLEIHKPKFLLDECTNIMSSELVMEKYIYYAMKSEGWHVLKNKPSITIKIHKSFFERYDERVNFELCSANKGVCLN